MREHTPEPWSVVDVSYYESSKFYIRGRGKDGRSQYVAHIPNSTIQPMEANARRIVAAVNACAGFDTESLELIGGETAPATKEIFAEHFKLCRQRDKLLEALKLAMDHIGAGNDALTAYSKCVAILAEVEASNG